MIDKYKFNWNNNYIQFAKLIKETFLKGKIDWSDIYYLESSKYENIEIKNIGNYEYYNEYGTQRCYFEGEICLWDTDFYILFTYTDNNFSGIEDLEWEFYKKYNSFTKTFTSQKKTKKYINTISEEIEFISKSSIDDVLMKEWLRE